MKLRTTLPTGLLALVPLATLGPVPAATRPGRSGPAEVEVLATGLVYPRGSTSGTAGSCTWPRPARAATP